MTSLYLELSFRVLAFASWSSFWPRTAVKSRLEPLLGFRLYRMLYNLGTVALLGWSYAFLAYKSAETPRLWDLQGHWWFRPLVYGIEGLGVFFLTALVQFGLPFWGLRNPPRFNKLHADGFYKITRHPLYWSAFCLFFGHTLVMGTTLAVLYFVLMELYNVVAVITLENRALARRFGPELKAFHAQSSTLPFWSILRGKAKLERGDLPWSWLAGAFVFTLGVAALHDPVILRTIELVRPVVLLGRSD